MEKYLFNDGTHVIKEVQSKEELKSLLGSCSDPTRTRIWIFNTSEWIPYSDFAKTFNFSVIPVSKIVAPPVNNKINGMPVYSTNGRKLFRKFLFFILIVSSGLLVYNFTRIKWEKAGSIGIIADRPGNSPIVNIDSLIQVIENTRGQKLDKTTRTNYRIRNTWPDKITLKLNTDRFNNGTNNKYDNIELSIDNSTGYNIDKAVVQLNTWKKDMSDSFRVNATDTFRFSNIGYVLPIKRKLTNSYQGDSISVSFFSIRSKAFNFCYSFEKQSNYGNNNDRWYCRE